jgi:hypothetical protein
LRSARPLGYGWRDIDWGGNLMRGIRILAAVASVGAVAFATAGNVGASGKKCRDGALCVWTGKNYKGTKYKVTEPGNIVKLPAKVNNKVSSAKNRWVNNAFLYETKNASGQSFCLGSGQNIPNFADFADEFNNDASSAFLQESPGACPP